jgi:hypothetical protein
MSRYLSLVICPKCRNPKGNLVHVPIEDDTTVYELPVVFTVTCEWCLEDFQTITSLSTSPIVE